MAILGISCLLSIKELFEQEERVEKAGFQLIPSRNEVL